jgi:hypothetical protein
MHATAWTFGWEALVAIGTLGLAFVTFLLVRTTKRMVKTASDELTLEKQRIEASQRPYVLPTPSGRWIEGQTPRNEVLPIRNAGGGVALNIRGRLYFPEGTTVSVVPTSLGPGDSTDLRINWGGEPRGGSWANARGYLLCEDVVAVTWRTDYAYREDRRRYIEVLQIGQLDELGEVEQDFPPASFE